MYMPLSKSALRCEELKKLKEFVAKVLHGEEGGATWIDTTAALLKTDPHSPKIAKYKGFEGRVIVEIHDLIKQVGHAVALEKETDDEIRDRIYEVQQKFEYAVTNFLTAACKHPALLTMMQDIVPTDAPDPQLQVYAQLIVPFEKCAQRWHRDHALGARRQLCIALSLDGMDLGTELVGPPQLKEDKPYTMKEDGLEVDDGKLYTKGGLQEHKGKLYTKREVSQYQITKMSVPIFAFDTYNIHRGPKPSGDFKKNRFFITLQCLDKGEKEQMGRENNLEHDFRYALPQRARASSSSAAGASVYPLRF